MSKFSQEQHASPFQLGWRKFSMNILSMSGLVVIIIALFLGILGYLVTPDESPFANRQYLELTTKKPGFSVLMLKVRLNEPSHKHNFLSRMLFGQRPDYRNVPVDSIGFAGDMVEAYGYSGEKSDALFLNTFNLADVLYALNPDANIKSDGQFVSFTTLDGRKLSLPVSEMRMRVMKNNLVKKVFLLGTDRFGRDLLSRLVIGARVSLSVGFIAVFISLLIGLTLGAVAGYFRGWVDEFIMWLINVVWSIPTLLLVIAITLVLGKGFWQVFVAVGLTMWVEVARVVRGQVLAVREKEFVEAARALGFSSGRIIFWHILPNVFAPVIIISAANFASAILMEAGLSFLGIGVQPPVPSWGTMIKDHYGYIIVDKAYLAILPGLAIMIMVLAFTLVGNGLRDALDIKTDS